jgi:rare lipoprotein A
MANRRSAWRARCAALLLVAASVAAVAAPAQALTGGAPTFAASAAGSGRGLVFSPVRSARATWYGPGFYGSRTACGQVLRPQTIGVAHRRLPCGTAVRFLYRGKKVVARVIDRGPYARGRTWDLTNGARRALRFDGSGLVRYAVALNRRRR